MTTDNICFHLQNRLIQTSETGGQWYSDTSPFSIPCFRYLWVQATKNLSEVSVTKRKKFLSVTKVTKKCDTCCLNSWSLVRQRRWCDRRDGSRCCWRRRSCRRRPTACRRPRWQRCKTFTLSFTSTSLSGPKQTEQSSALTHLSLSAEGCYNTSLWRH